MCKGLKELLQDERAEGERQKEEHNIKTMHSNGATEDMIAKLLSLDINYVKLVLSK